MSCPHISVFLAHPGSSSSRHWTSQGKPATFHGSAALLCHHHLSNFSTKLTSFLVALCNGLFPEDLYVQPRIVWPRSTVYCGTRTEPLDGDASPFCIPAFPDFSPNSPVFIPARRSLFRHISSYFSHILSSYCPGSLHCSLSILYFFAKACITVCLLNGMLIVLSC